MLKPKTRSAFIPHDRVQFSQEGERSRTKQSFREESNINIIMAKYQAGQVVDYVNRHGPSYGELPHAEDFSLAMNIVAEAKSMFHELPSSMRSRFDNDPAKFLDFMDDPKGNHDEMVEMGLLDPDPPAGDPADALLPDPIPDPPDAAPAAP